jgi:hypothetical protein
MATDIAHDTWKESSLRQAVPGKTTGTLSKKGYLTKFTHSAITKTFHLLFRKKTGQDRKLFDPTRSLAEYTSTINFSLTLQVPNPNETPTQAHHEILFHSLLAPRHRLRSPTYLPDPALVALLPRDNTCHLTIGSDCHFTPSGSAEIAYSLSSGTEFGVSCTARGESGSAFWDYIPGWHCWIQVDHTDQNCEGEASASGSFAAWLTVFADHLVKREHWKNCL